MRRNVAACVIGLLAGWLTVVGCSPRKGNDSQAFQKAAPEIKAVWEKAVVEDEANDYVAATTDYRSLMAQKSSLTEEQLAAVNTAALALNQRLYAAANAGDAAAQAAQARLAGARH